MTITVSKDVENSINAAVQSGRFTSVDDAMDKAVHLLLRQLELEQEQARQAAKAADSVAGSPITTFKPIWEEIEEITAGVPDEEFLKLPADGATQHDHYIYGTPKRPVTQ